MAAVHCLRDNAGEARNLLRVLQLKSRRGRWASVSTPMPVSDVEIGIRLSPFVVSFASDLNL
jgi:hypothetical protein